MSGARFREMLATKRVDSGGCTKRCAVADERPCPSFECWANALATRVQRAIAKNMRDKSRDSRAGIDCDAAPARSHFPTRTRNARCVRGTTVKSHERDRMPSHTTWQRPVKQSRRADVEKPLEWRRFRHLPVPQRWRQSQVRDASPARVEHRRPVLALGCHQTRLPRQNDHDATNGYQRDEGLLPRTVRSTIASAGQ